MSNACRLLELRMAKASCSGLSDLSWPAGFKEIGENFEAELGRRFDAMRLDQAAAMMMEFGRQTWSEGYLGED